MKNNISLIVSALSIALSLLLVFGAFNKKKIAYVRSSELVYSYLGMKDAHNKFEQKSQMWKANIDTLQRNYQTSISQYSMESPKLSAHDKEEREQILSQQQQSLRSYTEAINSKMQDEDKKMTEGVLNQINSFIENYGREHGYEVILGTTVSGNVLYGDDAIDITQEVLAALNTNYKGETISKQ